MAAPTVEEACALKLTSAIVKQSTQHLYKARLKDIRTRDFAMREGGRGEDVTIGGTTYRLNEKLREFTQSSSDIFLIRNATGKPFRIVKKYPSNSTMPIYDKYVAEYYRSHGVVTPAVIAQEGLYVVKEYRDYLKRSELYISDMDPAMPAFIDNSSNDLVNELRRLHAGFADWVLQKDPEAHAILKEKHQGLLERGDLKPDNRGFDPVAWKWRIIDP